MKKTIFALIFVLIVATGVGVYYLLSNLDDLVKTAIEKYASAATQTAVRVEQVGINLTDGAGAIMGLTVANPMGFDGPYAFSLGEIRLDIDLTSLQEEPYIINEIAVLAPQVFVEINKNNKTNLNQLKKNLMSSVPTSVPGESEDETVVEPRIIIRRMIFADGNIQVNIASLNNKEYQLKLPRIEMTNLGGNKGATPSELAYEIISRLSDRASDEVKKRVIDKELERLKAKARAKIEEEKASFKDRADIRLEEEKDKLKDKLKGLFGR